MKALIIIGFCIIGLAAELQAASSATTVAVAQLDGGLTGNECNGQAHGALIPYPGDCTKYLVCEWYSGTVMNCPSGLHFNPVLCVCDWPTSAGCTQGSNPTPTTVATTTAAPVTTPVPGTVPTPPSTPTPETTPAPETVPTPASTPPTTSTNPSTPTESTTSSQGTEPTIGPAEDVCWNQNDGTLSPYPWDCAWYIRCEDNSPVILPCQDGWLFNPILLICDYPENAGCIATLYPTPSRPTPSVPTTIPITTSTPTESTTSSQGTEPTIGPAEDVCLNQNDGTLSPYPWDCAWYIRCEDNSPVILPCQDGWLFNPILLICDYPENAGCIATPYPTPSIPTPAAPTTIPITTSTPTESTTSSQGTEPTIGPAEDVCLNQNDGTLSPYPWDCAWYIRCEDNSPVILPCQDGWLFNPILLICDYPENAGCIATPYPTPSRPTPAAPTTIPITTSTPTESTTSSQGTVPTAGPAEDVCLNQNDGTLSPYPWDCAWYIRCEDNSPVILPCQDGWLFNPILLICDYPENAGCIATPYPTPSRPTPAAPTTIPITTSTPTESTSSSQESVPTVGPADKVCLNQNDGTLSPYPWDCAWYIRCEDNSPVILPCQDGWLFNPILLICDYPENAGCIATPNPTPSRPTPAAPTTIPITTSTPTESTSSSQGTAPTVGPADEVCLNQNDGTLSPYPWDCAWYIRCEENSPVILPCQDGWLFNPILLICDYPENAGCIATPYPTPSRPTPAEPTTKTTPITTADPTTLSTPSSITTTTAIQPSTRPPYVGIGVCANHELGTLLPYPGKCSLYIICEEKAPIAYACDDGLEFNAEQKLCESPEDAGCSIIPTTTTTSTPVPKPTTLPTPNTASPTTSTASQPSTEPPYVGTGVCANQELGTLLPYPGKCSLYIICEEKAPIAYACNEGLEFNAELRLCESPEDAGCSTFPTTTTSPPEISTTPPAPPGMTGICKGQEEGDLIPYPNDCSKYIICENPIPIAQKCVANLHFNTDLGICDEPDSAGCDNSVTIPPPTTIAPPSTPGLTGVCKGHGEGDLISYPNSCNKYIRCEMPVPIAQTCKSGLYFNSALGICDTTESANCPGYSPPEVTTTAPPTTTTPRPPSLTGICHDQELGNLIPYPENCSKYIICESPVPIAVACKDGLHFNADLQICDDPAAAKCEPQPSTTTPGPTTEAPSSNVCCGLPIGALVPYPDDCTQYIRCDYPIPAAFSCCDGLHFNAATEKCEAIANASCQWYTTTTTTTTTTTAGPVTCDTQPNGTLLPYESDCKKYNYCSNGASITLPCPSGSVFSPNAGGCVAGSTCPTPT